MKQVRPERIPLHRAPFYFAPDFIDTREKWIETFASLLAQACEIADRAVDIIPGDGHQVSADIGLLRFTIDAEEGAFEVQDKYDDDDWSAIPDFSIMATPTAFRDELVTTAVPDLLRRDTKAVASICDWLTRSMNLRFDRAISNGHANYCCRKTELGEFARLDADQFALFVVDRRPPGIKASELDTASSRYSDTKLYSVCVVPTKAEVLRATPAAKAKDRGRLGRPPTVDHQLLDSAMLELMQSNKGVPDRKKPNWTNAIFADAVIRRMAERGESVGRTTVMQKIRPLIRQLKKARQEPHLRKSPITGVH